MKINREARQNASSFFRACFTDGQLDEAKVRKIVGLLAEHKPRNYMPVLQRFRKLVSLEIDRHTCTVESAEPLADKGAAIFANLEKKFGPSMATEYRVDSELVGGLRIQRGSNVWDGSIRARLHQLENAIANPNT